MSAIENRYDFVMFFDVENGNPNGDPDAGNSPRVDAETGNGYITDVCLKRKIRDYVDLTKEGVPGYNILIKPDYALNTKFEEAYEAEGIATSKKVREEKYKGLKGKEKARAKRADEEAVKDYMIRNYYDVRTFGAVMSTGDNPCGIVRGPVQLTFAKSCSPVAVEDITITRKARTTEERQDMDGDSEFADKSFIPYGLYRAEGFVSAALAQKTTKLSEEDLDVLWNAIINMFEEDHSASRGKMCMRKLYVFKHECPLGNAPSHVLFDLIEAKQITDEYPRAYKDYEIHVDYDKIPNGVELLEKI